MKIKELHIGEKFVYEGCEYVKIEPIEDKFGNLFVAVCIADGRTIMLEDIECEHVLPMIDEIETNQVKLESRKAKAKTAMALKEDCDSIEMVYKFLNTKIKDYFFSTDTSAKFQIGTKVEILNTGSLDAVQKQMIGTIGTVYGYDKPLNMIIVNTCTHWSEFFPEQLKVILA